MKIWQWLCLSKDNKDDDNNYNNAGDNNYVDNDDSNNDDNRNNNNNRDKDDKEKTRTRQDKAMLEYSVNWHFFLTENTYFINKLSTNSLSTGTN